MELIADETMVFGMGQNVRFVTDEENKSSTFNSFQDEKV
jgi:hypothetical protein